MKKNRRYLPLREKLLEKCTLETMDSSKLNCWIVKEYGLELVKNPINKHKDFKT